MNNTAGSGAAGRLATLRRLGAQQRGVAVGLVAQALQYGAAVLLLPFVVTRLSATEVAVWYVFVTIQGLATMADFGFQPTIARSFAAAFAGATELRREGFSEDRLDTPNLALVGSLLKVARRLYLVLALAVLVILLTAGTLYVSSLVYGHDIDRRHVEIAWVVFAIGTALNLYYLWISPLLIGAEQVSQNYLFVIANRGSFAALGIVMLLAGGGLLSIAIATLMATVLGRLVAQGFIGPVVRRVRQVPQAAAQMGEVLRWVWPNASRMGLVALGAFLTTRFNVLALSTLAGLATAAQYAISLQLISAVIAVAQLPMQVALPRFVAARVEKDQSRLRHIFLTRTFFYVATSVVGVGCVVAIGPWLLAMIGSHTTLLSTSSLVLLSIVLILEGNHANAGFVITTANRVPFVMPSLVAGSLIALFSTLAAAAGWGAVGVILSQGLVQIAYNNWKWPLVAWRDISR